MPSDLQITNIKDQANANSAITIASDGQVTVAQNNPTITLGSNTTFTGEHKHYTSGFLNSWQVWDYTSATSTEQGIRVRRMGLLYIVDVSMRNTSVGIGDITHKVLELGSHITHPSNTVWLGIATFKTAQEEEYYFNSYIDTSGHLYLRGYNNAGTGLYVLHSFVGLDLAE